MRQDDLPSDQHQIVDADSGPISATSVATHTQLGTDLPGLVKKEPYLFALLNPASTARRVGSVVKDKWYYDLGRLDCGAHDNKILSRKLGLLRFTLQRCLRHNSRFEADIGVCAQLLFRDSAFGLGVDGKISRRALARCGCFGNARSSLVVVVEAKGNFSFAGYLALLLEEGLGCRCTVLCKLACIMC
jgi:hypothetical protein